MVWKNFQNDDVVDDDICALARSQAPNFLVLDSLSADTGCIQDALRYGTTRPFSDRRFEGPPGGEEDEAEGEQGEE